MLRGPEPQSDRECLLQVYWAVQDMQKSLGELSKHLEDLNGRTRKLERWQATVTGRLIVCTAATSLAGTAAGYVLRGILAGGP